jgi:rhamnogalacturonan endolyase
MHRFLGICFLTPLLVPQLGCSDESPPSQDTSPAGLCPDGPCAQPTTSSPSSGTGASTTSPPGAATPPEAGTGTSAPAGANTGPQMVNTGGPSTSPSSVPTVGAPATQPNVPTPGEGGAGGTGTASPEPSAAPAGGAGPEGTGGSPDTPSPGGAACNPSAASGHFQLEALDRGLIAVRTGQNNYVGWRMFGYEYQADAARVSYNLYRDGELLANVTDSTNYLDTGGAADATYTVSVVMDGAECPASEPTTPWSENHITIPLEPPPAGTSPDGTSYAYDTGTVQRSTGAVNDGSPGDLDGDGVYDIVVIWEPSNAQDNSKAGQTGPVYMDAYTLAGERLWRMNLGPNVRAGAHYTQFLVYDLDGDGSAEVAFKTAPGVRDGTGEYLSLGPAAGDDDAQDYRNDSGYVLSGPEYLTVFEGTTGKELATVDFEIARGNVGDWGDDYGNRVDRFLATVGFVGDTGSSEGGSGRPALLMGRGYYTRATVSAWTWRDGELTRIWTADSDTNGSAALAGQGAHSMTVADVDGDDAQEIIYGAAMIQSDGSFGCSTGLGHGDALHVSDFVPSRPGLEVYMPHEDTSKPWWDVRNADTCDVLHQSGSSGSDNGRGSIADIVASNPGAEFWSAADPALRSATTNEALGAAKPSMTNFLIWWDADELRELEDATSINKGDGTRLFTCDECMSNNHTKATPTLTADLFGDWREEIIWRTPDSRALRVYTTTDVTARRIYTLMHDPQYRMQVTAEQTGYNQPPHTGFFLGDGMDTPPVPNIHVR